jgi:hypothetical protein
LTDIGKGKAGHVKLTSLSANGACYPEGVRCRNIDSRQR